MIRDFIKKKPGLFTLIILFSIISMAASAGDSLAFAYAFSALTRKDFTKFLQLTALFFVLAITVDVTSYVFLIYSKKMIESYNHRLREQYIQSLIGQQTGADLDVNHHVNTLTNDLLMLSEKYLWGFLKIINAIFRIAFAVLALFTYHWSLVVAAMLLAILMLIAPRLFQKHLVKATDDISTANQGLIATLNDWLGGLYELRWNRVTGKLWQQINPKAAALEQTYVNETKVDGFVDTYSNIVGSIATASLTLLASWLFMRNIVPIGTVANVGDFVFGIFTGLITLSNNISTHVAGKTISDKFQTFFDQRDETGGQLALANNQQVAFETNQLSYHYANKTITYPDFKIQPGEKVALVGPSGVGKTTLINLLTGALPDYQGELKINQQDLKTVKLDDLQQVIGVIPQHSHLFRTTIAENILLFDEQLASKLPDVLVDVNLQTTVANLKKGTDTIVDTSENTLSGGELQRISLARALIRDKKFLIIDEGTSALDETNARDIIQRLLAKSDITLLLITHTSDRQLLGEFDKIIELK